MNERPPPKTDTLAGTIVLLVLGLLVLVPSGLCTGYFGIGGLMGMMSGHDPLALLLLGGALVIGGPFVLGGGAMLVIGLRRLRRR